VVSGSPLEESVKIFDDSIFVVISDLCPLAPACRESDRVRDGVRRSIIAPHPDPLPMSTWGEGKIFLER
jgi:hypothetical protein